MELFLPKEHILGKYIHLGVIQKILKKYELYKSDKEGSSVLGTSIPMYCLGKGDIKILIWSQMHGNESTTTKSLLDVMKYIQQNSPSFLNKCTLYIIPILNPDGAFLYTRNNANNIDLNRDAKELSQPESQFLRNIFQEIKPNYCFNLHDQRSIFSVGYNCNPATISFLAPAGDVSKNITSVRIRSMEIIAVMARYLHNYIPNQIGRFDDTFNINCTGDMFTHLGVPTILFEAGHYPNDYQREYTRQYISQAILVAIQYISEKDNIGQEYTDYFQIPENQKLFYDVIIKDDIQNGQDMGILFKEQLQNNTIVFVPEMELLEKQEKKFGHKYFHLSEIPENKTIENILNFVMKNSFFS